MTLTKKQSICENQNKEKKTLFVMTLLKGEVL